MGLVEEIYTPAGIEIDELGTEAANANFDKDRESNPIKSNPKLSNNSKYWLRVRYYFKQDKKLH